ncbi:MAG TPA: PEP-CTERM sorting domain-containing protein [Kiritimatiellia bacterium]|nr:PEP-CTERM sorting domain-containing protein [Kiritimatiellia bacterium]
MKTKINALRLGSALLAIAIHIPQTAPANLISVYNSYAVVSIDGGSRQWYNASGSGNPAFSTFAPELDVGQNLYLGGQARTQNPVNGAGVTVTMFWRLRAEGDPGQFTNTVSSGNFALPYRNTQSGYDRWEQHPVPGETPGSITHNVDVLNGIGPGDYRLQVWYNATDGNVTVWDSNSGANFTSGIISVVPEPSTSLLMLLGALGIMGVRRRIRTTTPA